MCIAPILLHCGARAMGVVCLLHFLQTITAPKFKTAVIKGERQHQFVAPSMPHEGVCLGPHSGATPMCSAVSSLDPVRGGTGCSARAVPGGPWKLGAGGGWGTSSHQRWGMWCTCAVVACLEAIVCHSTPPSL